MWAWIVLGIILYFVVGTLALMALGKLLREVSKNYPPVHDWEPRE
jgi:hypothetical protein